MKKLFGKIILAILTLCMAFAVIGCGGGDNGDNGDNGGNNGGNNPPAHTAHEFVDGKCSCGQYELFLAVSNENMSNFTLVMTVEKDTKNTSPDGSHVYGPEAGTRKTKEVHTIKVADGKFYEEYVIRDYDTDEILEQGTKNFTGAEATKLKNSIVSQTRGYAFYEKFYNNTNLFTSTSNGYVLNQSNGFSYNGYYYNMTSGAIEDRNNSSVEILKNALTIKVEDGKIAKMTFVSKENCSDAQKSWYIETLSAEYAFSNYGTTTIA